jgi:hypothetical protein
MSDVMILTPANTAPPVKRVWMFVSRDAEGRENVCGSLMGELGIQPLMTGNPRLLKKFMPVARELARQCAGTERTIELLVFTCRKEVVDWEAEL